MRFRTCLKSLYRLRGSHTGTTSHPSNCCITFSPYQKMTIDGYNSTRFPSFVQYIPHSIACVLYYTINIHLMGFIGSAWSQTQPFFLDVSVSTMIQSIEPGWLIFVQGLDQTSWWGANHQAIIAFPLVLPVRQM